MARRITVRGIIKRNGLLFAVKHKTNDGGAADYWATPGGGLDPNESLHDGVIRELIEETGVTPRIGKLLLVQQYREDDKEFLEFFFEVLNVDDYKVIDLAATSHGEAEIAKYGFIDPKTENLLPVCLQDIDALSYNETTVFDYLKENT